jgi:hypothetical protein
MDDALVIKRLKIVGNFKSEDEQYSSTKQVPPDRLSAERSRYCDRNVVLGHYCDTRQITATPDNT